MSLANKIMGLSTLKKRVSILADSEFLKAERITTDVPELNIALSGSPYGGFVPGLTFFAAPSKHFKTNFSLKMVSAFLKRYDDGVAVLVDSEYGITSDYLMSMGVDPNRVVHVPVTNIEEMKFEMAKLLEGLSVEDNVIFLVDSIGNLASKKEVEDALDGKSVADMTRAKALKSLFRIITPILVEKKIPAVVVNHVYETQEMFSKTIMSGGTGPMLSANSVFFLTKSKEKEKVDGKDELAGFTFKLYVEKSRFVREGAVIPVSIHFKTGIQKWTGVAEIAKKLGWLITEKQGWYNFVNPHTGEALTDKSMRLKDINNNEELWNSVCKAGLSDDIQQYYSLASIPDADDLVDIDDELLEG